MTITRFRSTTLDYSSPARGARFYELSRRDLSGRSLRYPDHPGEDLLRPGMDGHPPRDGPASSPTVPAWVSPSRPHPLGLRAPRRIASMSASVGASLEMYSPTPPSNICVVVRRESDHDCVG